MLALTLWTALAEMRPVDGFHGVVNQSPLDVTIVIGDSTSLQVEGLLEHTQRVKTDVVAGILVITVEDAKWRGDDAPRVNLTVPRLDQVGAESAGDVRVKGKLEANDLQLWSRAAGGLEVEDVSGKVVSLIAEGAGDLRAGTVTGDTVLLASRGGSDVHVTAVLGKSSVYEVNGAGEFRVERHQGKRLEARMSGAGSLRVVGAAEELEVESKGAAEVNLGGLKVDRAKVVFEGASNGSVYVEKSLEAQVYGASSLVHGGPAKVASRTDGAATVKAIR